MSTYDGLGLDEKQKYILSQLQHLPPTADLRADRVALGEERDGIQATRPPGCWCLGVGGKHPAHRSAGGKEWGGFHEHCSCPEGVARRQKDVEEQSAYRNAAARDRADLFREEKLPARFRGFDLETYPSTTDEQRAVLEHIRAWLEDDWYEDTDGTMIAMPQWLLLHGPYGTGKTGLASPIAAEMIERHKVDSVEFVAVPRLLDRIRATFNRRGRDEERESDVFDELFDAEGLVLDDVGAERATDWATEKLFTLINHRHDEELKTVITSNLDPAQLAEHLGERTMWRIAELSYVVSLEGCPNLRLPKSRRAASPPDVKAEPRGENVVPIKRGAA